MKKLLLLILLVSFVFGASYSESASSQPAWASETIEVVGYGVMNFTKFPKRSQAKLVAKRAANRDARRKLLDKVLDLRAGTNVTVRDLALEDNALNPATSGLIRKADIIRTNFKDGTYTVRMRLELKDVYKYLKKKKLLD